MAWCLVANTGMLHILQHDIMLIGRENSDITIQSRTVDKQHSVIAYDKVEGAHSIKDVGTLNGTFVNESRIPDDTYVALRKGDTVRFGYAHPITYRFDSLQLDNISVVKDQGGFIKQEMSDLRNLYYEEEEEEMVDAFLNRHKPPDYHQAVQRAMQQRNARENSNAYSRQQNNFQDPKPASHGSPLYGQPAWWGENENPSPDGSSTPDHLRQRTNTASTQGSLDENLPLDSSSPVDQRPTRLQASQNEPERDIPVVFYDHRRSSDLRPTVPRSQVQRTEQAEVTLMAAKDKSIGFTIEFGGGNDDGAGGGGGGGGGPKKMARPDSLQNCIPQNVRQKIEKSTRMMEELKAERLMKKSMEEETMQSPRASPLSVRNDGWTGAGPTGGRRTPRQTTPDIPPPGYQDATYQQRRSKAPSNNCLSEPLPPSNVRQRTFVKSSQGKGKPAHSSPSPTVSTPTPVSPCPEDDVDDLHYEEEDEVDAGGEGEGDGEGDGGGDDVSEAGTYTIESDSHHSKEAQEAREKIDEVFGVGHDQEHDHEEEEEVEKLPSDDDTDKDVPDEEIDEDEVFGVRQNGRRLEGGPGLRVRGDGSSRTGVDKIDDIESKPGGPGTPQWVQQWATMTSKSTPRHTSSPDRHKHMSPDRGSPDMHSSPDRLVSPDRMVDHVYETEQPPPRMAPDRDDIESKKSSGSRGQSSVSKTTPASSVQSQDSASPRGSRGKRILPSTPAELLHPTRQSSNSSGSEQTMRQNGFQASNSSAFHSPRNHVSHKQQEQPDQQQYRQDNMDRSLEEKAFGINRRKLHGSSDPIVPPAFRQGQNRRDSWEPEGSMDTDVLLKDTETLMRNLEERMRTKRQETPSPEMSDSQEVNPHDVSQDMSAISFEADVDTDIDTASNVSLTGGNHTWAGSKSRNYSCPEDNGSYEPVHYSNGRQKTPKSVEKTRTTSAQPRSSSKSSASAEKGTGIWNRLSTPNKHKMASEKENDVSDSDHSFQRNTRLTGSLPTGRVSNRSVSKSNTDSQKTVKKPKSLNKPSISTPRQTRSTMLRKNRFSEDSGADHSDISPSSSMSDLSSSKNFRRGGSMRETRSGAVSDSGRRTPVERSRGRTTASSTRNGDASSRNDHSLGSQIARHARTQSMQDHRMKASEPRPRQQTTGPQSRAVNLSRKSSLGSSDVRKTSSGAWRRYDGPEHDSDHDVESYIKNVSSRRSTPQHHNEERQTTVASHRQAAAVQRQKSSSLQNLQSSAPQRSSGPMKAPPNLRVEIAQASNTLAQNLQRLAQGESINEIQVERIPKEQQMMDEMLSDDAVNLSRQDIWQGERRHPQVPLQRSSSLSFQPDQNSPGLLAGSPPFQVKKKQWNKSESHQQDNVSFDSLVLSSIHHLSIKMKDASDKIAYKLKKLQQPGAGEDELSRVLRDSEFPLLKTNNKEVAGILQNLRKMEKRLEEIHSMVDPRNEIKLPEQLSPVNQMRRQYATEFNFGTVSDSESPRSMTSAPRGHVGRAPVNAAGLQRQRHVQQQQQQQHQQQQQQYHQEEEEEYYL